MRVLSVVLYVCTYAFLDGPSRSNGWRNNRATADFGRHDVKAGNFGANYQVEANHIW